MMDVLKALKYSNSSKNVAKERLKLILIQDRTNIPPQFLAMIKGDLIRVISDYAEIDEEGMDITVDTKENNRTDDGESLLVASIPIRKVKSIGK